jgi:hypothetical protein
MERAVGFFLLLAVGLLAFGFFYYLYKTAERKGWFLTKAKYYTFVKSAAGLKVGDPVRLMGFEAGSLTEITPMPGYQFTYNVYVAFQLKDPNYGYIWTEGSVARVAAADFLGKRALEVTKGTGGYPTYVFYEMRSVSLAEAQILSQGTNWFWGQEFTAHDGSLLAKPLERLGNIAAIRDAGYTEAVVLNTSETRKSMTGMWSFKAGRYEVDTEKKGYWLEVEESPAVTERLESVVAKVEQALPGILALTNQLASVLHNADNLLSNLNAVAVESTPVLTNLAVLTAQLDRPGALGEWLVPTNINQQLETTLATANTTLGSANGTLTSVNTNLTSLVQNLARSLDNLASMTSNLNQQVEANTNILTGVSQAITHADELMQGLKRHWLLRSAFKEKNQDSSPQKPGTPVEKLRAPKDAGRSH